MSFPPNTRLAIGFMLALVFAILLGVLWRQDRRQAALRDWSIACLLIAAGSPLRVLPELWPGWVRIAGSNALLILAFASFWAGARVFRGVSAPPVTRFAGVALWLASLPWLVFEMQERVSLVSGIIGIYALL